MRDLTGKVAWVTGAGSGIGAAAARHLASQGMKIVLSGRRVEPLEQQAEEIRAKGGSAMVLTLDVADQQAVAQAVEKITGSHGQIDVLVNAAGLNIKQRSWQDVSPKDWDLVVDVDLNGVFYCCQAVLPAMRAQRDGLIINLASWAALYPVKITGPAYAASKHGVVAMTESLNMEEGVNGIRACVVYPEEVNTAILNERPVPPTDEARMRMLQEDDLGETFAFLARLSPHACIQQLAICPTYSRYFLIQDAFGSN
ncbi:SDR family oxidoreductase [Rhodobacteraceae bacterium NNCM2]|nr:SDR family oxidoreductase [Coraliihabitans acroporae]